MTLTAPVHSESDVPRATRSHRPGWRNPRLLLGIILIAGSVVIGGRLFAAADDTVGVWALAKDLPAGAAVGEQDLAHRRVRFPDSGTADRYLATSDTVPDGTTLNRPVTAGELLPRAAFTDIARIDLVEVPISVGVDDLPATVRQGSVVDVWVTPQVSAVGRAKVKAFPVLTDVVVVAVPRASDGLAPQATRQVIVGVPSGGTDALGTALGAISDGRVVIARKE